MNIKEFSINFESAVSDLIVLNGDESIGINYILNFQGVNNFDKIEDFSHLIYTGDGLCPRAIDIGLTKNESINEVYIVVSGHEYIDCSVFRDKKYKLPINIMGKAY